MDYGNSALIKLMRSKSIISINRFCLKESELWYSSKDKTELMKHHLCPHELAYIQYLTLLYSDKIDNENYLSPKYLNKLAHEMSKFRKEQQINNLKSKNFTEFLDFYASEQTIFQIDSLDYVYDMQRMDFILNNCAPAEKEKQIDIDSIIRNNGYSSFERMFKSCLYLAFLAIDDIPRFEKTISSPCPSNYLKPDLGKTLESLSIPLNQECRRRFSYYDFLFEKPLLLFRNKYYLVDQKLFFRSLSNFQYNVIKKNGPKSFTSLFGKYFENYLKKFLQNYLSSDSFHKIPESSVKTPDWIIKFKDYIFVVEQKSGLKPRETYNSSSPDSPNLINNYINNNLYEHAGKQLSYYKTNSKKTVIRIALTLEMIFSAYEIEDNLIKKYKNDYWVCTISDFEKIIELSKTDEKLFNQIIEEKHCLDLQFANKGRSLKELLQKHECNNYPDFLRHLMLKNIDDAKKDL